MFQLANMTFESPCICVFSKYINIIRVDNILIYPTNFSPSEFSWTFLMVSPKASPCSRTLRIGNASHKYFPTQPSNKFHLNTF